MRIAGSYQYPTMEAVIYGKPAAARCARKPKGWAQSAST